MFLFIIIGLFGLGMWYFLGAVGILLSICPFILALPYIFVKDVIKAWKDVPRFRASEARRLAFEADMAKGIKEHEEWFPEANDVDENGIPYL